MLETIWFLLWTLLWAVYFMLDGFDLGLGVLMPFIARDERERRIVYNATGAFWDGNEVWLIAAGGVTFAAFPKVYAVMFSALYAPLMLLLFALILRAASYEFRSKVESACWRAFWDVIHFIVNLIACLVLGVFFANLFMGIPVTSQGVYEGSFFGLFNPYGIAGGLFFLLMFMMHGALWLSIRTTGELQSKTHTFAAILWIAVAVFFILFLILSIFFTKLFHNYFSMPWLIFVPLLAVAGLFAVPRLLNNGKLWLAWGSSCLFIVSVTFFGVLGLYPSMIISTIDPAATITAFNGCSTPLTLKIMLGVTLVVIPIVLLYQIWMYRLLSKPVSDEDLHGDHAY